VTVLAISFDDNGAVGDKISGGSGSSDMIQLSSNHSGSFFGATISNVEKLELLGSAEARFNGNFFGISAIATVIGGGGDAFTFIGSAVFTGDAGQLRYVRLVLNGYPLVEGDIDGNGTAEFQIQVKGIVTFTGADFDL
jgi:hypothetical protein